MTSPYLDPPPRSLAEARAEFARRREALPQGSAAAAGLTVVIDALDDVLAARAAAPLHDPPQPTGDER